MKNHFHVLVYIKKDDEINIDELAYKTVKNPKKISASIQFGHLFNSYCQAFNKRFKRTGSLFESPFERKLVNNETYFQKLIYYIHYNPVHHRFNDSISDYPWSSYYTVLSQKKTKLKRENVIERFSNLENFKSFHSKIQDLEDISDFMIDFPF
jgi:putative transposase